MCKPEYQTKERGIEFELWRSTEGPLEYSAEYYSYIYMKKLYRKGTPKEYEQYSFFFKLYIIVLVLPNIKMNLPQVYMCSPS